MELRKANREFLEYLEIEKGRSPRTIDNYRFYLERFAEWSGAKNVKNVSSDKVREYHR